jgi:sugar/nucleoside kinase (ribokinase family)
VDDFKAYNICIVNCVYYEACDAPTSIVIISQTTGSRTIIHSNKNLPELTLDDFKKLDLSQYSWIHFEASYLAGANAFYATNAKAHHWTISLTSSVDSTRTRSTFL